MSVKEKIKETASKVKAKLIEVKNATVTYVVDHPGTVIGVLIGGAVIGAAIRGANEQAQVERMQYEAMNQSREIQEPKTPDLSNTYLFTVEDKQEPEQSKWQEKYRETYDRVVEFSKTLDLEEGESYCIEDQKQYESIGAPQDEGPVISHLIYGQGVYPTEV